VSRLPAVEGLAAAIARLPLPARVAVDGVDAAGKTTLADELAAHLRADRISADDFLRPPEERYRRGRESPEGYYLVSFDHYRLRRAVLSGRELVIVDGIFLQRPELDDLWDYRVFVHVELEESLRRGVERDGGEDLYRRRYLPGQELYLERVRPRERADAVLDNNDPQQPVLTYRD
jgi:uridine kinase